MILKVKKKCVSFESLTYPHIIRWNRLIHLYIYNDVDVVVCVYVCVKRGAAVEDGEVCYKPLKVRYVGNHHLLKDGPSTHIPADI